MYEICFRCQDKSKFQTLQAMKNNTDVYMPITRVVFIDSTWNQCKGIYKDPKLQGEKIFK